MEVPSKVLIIDDDPNFLEIFGAKLASEGFSVEAAEGGIQGLIKAKESKPDIILMDVKMPDIDGVEAMTRLKEDPDTANIKVVFLTNMGDVRPEIQKINARFAQESGAAGYIRKTDDLSVLVERVRSYL